MENKTLAVHLPGLDLKNPIMPASGTFGFGDVPQARAYDLNRLGAIVLKTTTPEARKGNPQPQIWKGDHEVINAVGLTNPGVDVVIQEKIPALRADYPNLPIIASVGGSTPEDYVTVARKLSSCPGVAALELNISCPNVQEGGMAFGTQPEAAEELTRAVKEVSSVPVYVKLTQNVTDIVAIAQAAREGGADGLTMINTLLGMRINPKTRKPVVANTTGGLSGRPLRALAIRMIYQVSQAVDLPIIGVGGVETADDVVEMFLAGASAVQIGTAHFYNGMACPDVIDALPGKLKELEISSLEDLRREVKENRQNF